jgi:hypothetical protein
MTKQIPSIKERMTKGDDVSLVVAIWCLGLAASGG